MRTPLVFQFSPSPPSLPLSLPRSSSATGDSQSAIIRPRNCSERHFLTPFLDPPSHRFTRLPLLYRFYRPSSGGIKPPLYYSSPYSSSLFHPSCCSITSRNMVSIVTTEKITSKRNGWSTRVGVEREMESERHVAEEWRIPPRNSTKQRKQCLRI